MYGHMVIYSTMYVCISLAHIPPIFTKFFGEMQLLAFFLKLWLDVFILVHVSPFCHICIKIHIIAWVRTYKRLCVLVRALMLITVVVECGRRSFIYR